MPTPPKAKRDPAAIRKALLDDPNTRGIAANLGVAVEDYVAQVVHFALHPDQEPSLYIVQDQDLLAAGQAPPDADAMGTYLLEAIGVHAAVEATEYTAPRKELVSLAQTPAAQAPEKVDERLKEAVDRERLSERGRKG